jgi:hypothetical protein
MEREKGFEPELPTRFRVLAVADGRRRPFYCGDRL